MLSFETAELTVRAGAQWLKLAIEVSGALVIGVGMALALGHFLAALARRAPEDFNPIRLSLARYLALALEFQLGADILGTAIAPTWTQIGQLGAVAVLRTGLNYFLTREMAQESTPTGEAVVHDRASGSPDAAPPGDVRADR